MELQGYLERGLINSLFCDISNYSSCYDLLNDFLSLIEFPHYQIDFNVNKVSLLIE